MNWIYSLTGLITIILLVYLIYALLNAEEVT